MFRGWLIGVVVLAANPVFAQEPLRFQWKPGQVLTYSVQQTIAIRETARQPGADAPVTTATATKLNLTRRWDVKSLDAAGTATLEMSITAMRQEINRPGGPDAAGKPTIDTIVLDSATGEGRKQMAAFLGKPIVTAKVDARGRLLDAKATAGSADRLRAELPFRVVLPEQAPAAGGSWQRAFVIQLDPPAGTGEKYDATQTYTLKGEAQGHAVVGVATALKAAPKDPAEVPPLVPLLWEGEVYFHKATGRYAGAKLSVKQEVANHQGDGTKFVYESQYTEALVEK
jgi:hypothetical protein